MSTTHTFRPDHVSAETVETGIELADQVGPESAAEYLSQRGVLEPVIERVVSQPAQRRNPGRLRSRDERRSEEATRFKYLL